MTLFEFVAFIALFVCFHCLFVYLCIHPFREVGNTLNDLCHPSCHSKNWSIVFKQNPKIVVCKEYTIIPSHETQKILDSLSHTLSRAANTTQNKLSQRECHKTTAASHWVLEIVAVLYYQGWERSRCPCMVTCCFQILAYQYYRYLFREINPLLGSRFKAGILKNSKAYSTFTTLLVISLLLFDCLDTMVR